MNRFVILDLIRINSLQVKIQPEIVNSEKKMSVIVVAEFPMTKQGAQDFIEWSKSDDGYVITRQHKGFKDIRTFLAEDKKKVYLYEKWESKEDHQAYLNFRVKDGLMDFLNPRLDGDFKVTYFSEE